MRSILIIPACWLTAVLSSIPAGPANAPHKRAAAVFTNPLLPSGPDPAVEYRRGYYYYMDTTGTNLTIWKTRDITDLQHARKKIVWTALAAGPYSRDIWAPEIHFVAGKWYLYFAGDAGKDETHRLFVLEDGSADPLEGNWTMKGEVADSTNQWAIDASVFNNRGKLYLMWSGWESDAKHEQNIYIARLKNPWTVEDPRVKISHAQFDWEKFGDDVQTDKHYSVDEGPEILKHDGRLFLIYSASGCWTDHYALGMLEASSRSDLLNPASWKKSSQPVFSSSADAQAFGTGHNTFFKSPDGKQDWILYHANPARGEGCGNQRSPRAQRFTWNADGMPNFGKPIPLKTPIEKPSGTRR